jgi:hypothetical protein
MKTNLLIALLLSLILVVMVFSACATTTTVKTITIPGITTTLPAVTITLPGKTTTIPATTVAIPATVTEVPIVTEIVGNFLPSTPTNITSHMANVVGDVTGDCLGCHGPGTTYNEFPLPPSWNANEHGSSVRSGFFYVLPGSIQDHTGRTADMCLGCHRVVK